MAKKILHVAVGVIINADGQICIAKRPLGKPLAGLWEFPGGKVEAGESVFQALVRELDEELGILPLQSTPLIEIEHSYPEQTVLLDVHTIEQFDGEPQGREQQEVRWIQRAELRNFEFPAANKAIVDALILMDR